MTRCHRSLRNPGVPVTVGGKTFLFGTVCASKLAPKRKSAGRVQRAKRVEQRDLFAEAGL